MHWMRGELSPCILHKKWGHIKIRVSSVFSNFIPASILTLSNTQHTSSRDKPWKLSTWPWFSSQPSACCFPPRIYYPTYLTMHPTIKTSRSALACSLPSSLEGKSWLTSLRELDLHRHAQPRPHYLLQPGSQADSPADCGVPKCRIGSRRLRSGPLFQWCRVGSWSSYPLAGSKALTMSNCTDQLQYSSSGDHWSWWNFYWLESVIYSAWTGSSYEGGRNQVHRVRTRDFGFSPPSCQSSWHRKGASMGVW